MPMDHADFLRDRPVRAASALVMLFLAWMFLPGSSCVAQKAPPFVVTTQTTLAAYPPTPATGTTPTPVLQGAGFGSLAVNKYGDVFVGGYNSNTVVEFPAATMNQFNPVTATVPYNVLYNAYSGGHAGAVGVDPNGNLVVSEVFQTVITMIPYVNGAYTPFTNPDNGSSYSGSNPPNPPVCTTATPATGAACSYDFPLYYYAPGITDLQGSVTNSPTGGFYQVASFAFDPAGNSFMATFGDSMGDTNIFECSVACNYSGAPPVQLFEFADPVTPTNKDQNYMDSIAVDANDNIYIANNSTTIWMVPAGPQSASFLATPLSSAFIDAQGVAFDQAGNLYVTDNGTSSATAGTVNGGIYEIPLENGALNPADMFMVFPLDTVSYCAGPNSTTVPCSYPGYAAPWNISDIGVAVDQHGNIFQAVDYNTLYKYTVGSASFAATTIGSSTPATATLTLTFSGSTPITLQSSSVASAGTPSAEFSIVTGTGAGTCVIGAPATPNARGTSCTVVVQFTPAEPGLRTAILTLTDSAGDAVPVTLSGVAVGQAITVDPGALNAIGSGLKSPQAVAVDASGNVFVADAGANAVYEYAGGGGSGASVGSGLKSPAGVATDAAGNLYISDTGNNRVVTVPNNGGVLNTASQSTLLSSLNSPGQLAVDFNGTLYIPETGSNDVVAFAKPTGLATSGLKTILPIPNLVEPTAVAVDANDILYIADKGNVVESAGGTVSNVGSNLTAPTGVAVDGSGSVLIADSGSGRIVRVPNEGGVLTGSHQTIVNNAIISPYAVQLDAVGNLYATDSANSAAYSVSRTSGAIAFGKVNDTTSSAGQTAVLSSSGPGSLTMNSPLFPALSSSVPFTIPSSSDQCTGLATLVSGYSCTLEAYFAHTLGMVGAESDTVDFNTGAENTGAPSLTLSGNAVNEIPAAITLVQTVPSGSASYGSSVTVSATVVSAVGTSTLTPTGTVQFIVDGNNVGQPQQMDASGTASFVLTGLGGGSHLVAASYSGDAIYAPASSTTLTVKIVPAASTTTLSILGYAADPTTAEPANASNSGDTVVMTATVVPSTPGALSGPVVFTSGGTTLGTAFVSGSTANSITTYTAVLTLTGPTALKAGTYNVVATFKGNENYTGSASAPSPLIVANPTFTMGESVTAITSSTANPGSMTITLTSESGFTGAVDFRCGGLPAHATCQFIPDVLVLTQQSSSPIVVPPLQTKLTILIDQAPIVTPTGIFWWSGLLLGFGLFGLAGARNARRRLLMQGMAACLLLGALAGLSGCGSGTAILTTPTGSSKVTVTAVSTGPTTGGGAPTNATNVTKTMSFTLTVK